MSCSGCGGYHSSTVTDGPVTVFNFLFSILTLLKQGPPAVDASHTTETLKFHIW